MQSLNPRAQSSSPQVYSVNTSRSEKWFLQVNDSMTFLLTNQLKCSAILRSVRGSGLLLHWAGQILGLHICTKASYGHRTLHQTRPCFSLNDVNSTSTGTGVSHPVASAPLDQETLSWMTAFPPLLAILGSVLSSVLLDILGRGLKFKEV